MSSGEELLEDKPRWSRWSGLYSALKEGRSEEESYSIFRRAREEAEAERRASFGGFGGQVARDRYPATRVYHLHSRLPFLGLGPSVEEVEALTRSLDYKSYRGAHKVGLPAPRAEVAAPLGGVIRGRRSVREFSREPVSFEQAAQLLTLACGVTLDGVPPHRAAPSAGALFGVESYLLAFGVDGLEKALYHFAPLSEHLEYVHPLRGAEQLWPLLASELHGISPAVAIALSARLARVQAKYRERAYRFLHLEAGHIAQNLLLVAAALGLGAVPVGGFVDDEMDSLLGLDGEDEISLYLILIGVPS